MTRRTRFLLWLVRALRWKHRIIAEHSPLGPYMCRIWLTPDRPWWRRRYRARFLQYFYRGDSDRLEHNHPWEDAVSLILTGGYREHRALGGGKRETRVLLPFSLNRIGRMTFHRVELLDPERGCWTLFSAGRGVKRAWRGKQTGDWGFLMPDGSVLFWKDYLGDHPEDE